jgi:hypothetical protein
MWKQVLYETSLYGKGEIDETLANFIKQSTQQRRKSKNKGGKERNKERGPNSKPEEQSPKWVTVGGIRTNHVPKALTNRKKHIRKRGIASEQIVFQNPHQSQEAYEKEKGM